jgi:hypothetical protein
MIPEPTAAPVASAALPGQPITTSTPVIEPSGGFSYYSLFVFGIFCYALYQIAKRYFAQVRNEMFNKQYKEKDFADGFL